MENWRETELQQQLELQKKLMFFLCGNIDAVKFCIDILFVAHLWDDLVDGDKERNVEEQNAAFRAMLGDVPNNPFYQQNITALAPLMMSSILQWQDANAIEKDEKAMSYFCRNAMMSIIHYCVFLTGGYSWAEKQGPVFWREFSAGFASKYQEFLTEVK